MFRSVTTAISCLALAVALPYSLAVAGTPSSPVGAPSAQNASVSKDTGNSGQNIRDQETEKRNLITSEAIAAVGETRNALKALDDNKKDDALAALEHATGKLDILLARDPKLALAPTNVNESTTSILADPSKVKEIRRAAEELLSNGQVQAARHLLEGLASETVISVTNIPLGTYPDAIKQAVKLIDEGKQDEAKKVLQTALNTLVVNDAVIPLPVVAAQALLSNGEQLAEKSNRSVDENKQLSDDLEGTRAQLEFAEALGYGTKSDFKNLYNQISDIQNKTKDGKSGTGLFTKIKSFLSEMAQLSQHPPAQIQNNLDE